MLSAKARPGAAKESGKVIKDLGNGDCKADWAVRICEAAAAQRCAGKVRFFLLHGPDLMKRSLLFVELDLEEIEQKWDNSVQVRNESIFFNMLTEAFFWFFFSFFRIQKTFSYQFINFFNADF